MKHDLRYGGALTGKAEMNAIIKSIYKSNKTGNWQTASEAKKMEEESAKFLGVKYGILTTSGSCAGLLALSALELPRGSEVIISAVTFPTIFNIILQCNLTPLVVDAKVGTYNLDVDEVEQAIIKSKGKVKAVIAVHAVGNPCDMPRLMKIAKKYNVKVIEDNCDGWGSTIGKRKVGSFGDVSITSFHAAHIVSMGVGGGIFTNDSGIAQKVRQYRDWGRIADTNKPHNCKTLPKDQNPRFVYDKIGYNFQILELQAAMGRVQLRKSNKIKKLRKKNFNYLFQGLGKLDTDLIFPSWVPNADVCWFAFPLSVLNNRGELVAHLEKHGIETRSMFSGDITKHPAYKNTKYKVFGKLTEAQFILKNSFWITCHPRLKKADLDYIINVFKKFYNVKTS
jgi:CDP-6-deoxy-D-xylo-4-hexulose-3-dehydrase